MTTSTLAINAAPQSNAKKIGAAIALAMFSSLVGLSAISSSAHAYGHSTPNISGSNYAEFDALMNYSLY